MLSRKTIEALWQRGKSENGGPCPTCSESVEHYTHFARLIEERVLRRLAVITPKNHWKDSRRHFPVGYEAGLADYREHFKRQARAAKHAAEKREG